MSQYGSGIPQIPFIPPVGSQPGSEYGGAMPIIPMPYQNTGSVYGMMPSGPRTTMTSNFNMFGGGMGGVAMSSPSATDPAMQQQQRPMSMFSLATSVNPFAGPSMNPDPSDDELIQALRNYLSTQDLMTVTKK